MENVRSTQKTLNLLLFVGEDHSGDGILADLEVVFGSHVCSIICCVAVASSVLAAL